MSSLDDEAINWKEQYTEEQLAAIAKYWRDNPPVDCKGNCNLNDYMFFTGCKSCGWCDQIAIDNLDNAYKE